MVASHDRTGFLLTRRRTLALGALAGGLAVLPRPAKSVVRLDITEGNFQPLPIAIPKFFAAGLDDGDAANAVTQIITANLQRSGLFAPIEPTAYIERIPSFDAVPRFSDWRNINAQALVTGQIGRQTDGRLQAKFRLWDVLGGQQLDGKQYPTAPNWRRIAHIISDAIYERLTGQGGYFDSRVVFIDETGPSERRAARDHGSGRRQCALSHPRRRARSDATLLTIDAGNYLHGLRPGRSSRLSVQYR